MYILKQIPEDFFVKEIINLNISEGNYAYCLLKKKNYATLRAIQKISKYFRIPLKRIGFAGSKDKKALTEQMISIAGIKKEQIKKINLKDLKLIFQGYGKNPLSLGDNDGNYFEITLRNLDSENPKLIEYFTNFFGEQRFSINNAEIGENLIKKNFKKAIELILENEKEYKEDIEQILNKNPNNYISALQTLPKKILMFYLHAYQSLIWNKTAKILEKEFDPGKNNPKIPIVGFSTDIKEIDNKQVKNTLNELMQKEKLTERSFIIKELQGLSPEGHERTLFAPIQNLKISEKINDELNEGKTKIKISFSLQKGSYATEAIKALFSQPT